MSFLDNIDPANIVEDNDYAKITLPTYRLLYYIKEQDCNIIQWKGFKSNLFVVGKVLSGVRMICKYISADNSEPKDNQDGPYEIIDLQQNRKESCSADQIKSLLFYEGFFNDSDRIKCFPSPIGYYDYYNDNPVFSLFQVFAHDPAFILYIWKENIYARYPIIFLENIASYFIYKPRYVHNQESSKYLQYTRLASHKINISEKEWSTAAADKNKNNPMIWFGDDGVEYVNNQDLISKEQEYYNKLRFHSKDDFQHSFIRYKVKDEDNDSIYTIYVHIYYLIRLDIFEYDKQGFIVAFMTN